MINLINKIKSQKGNVLLLTLLLLASLIATVTLLSRVFLNELRMSTNIDHSLMAYYAAEESTEQGLYLVRKTSTTLDDLLDSKVIENNATWERYLESDITSIIGDIERNKSIQIDLYDPDNPSAPSGVESLQINWVNLGSWIEVSIVEWTPGATVDYSDITVKFQYPADNAVINFFNAAKDYRVTIKALYDDVDDLEIIAYDADNGAAGAGSPVDIGNYITMTSVGEFGQSQQAIEVVIPRKAPVLGLFDYVIFSEESIIK